MVATAATGETTAAATGGTTAATTAATEGTPVAIFGASTPGVGYLLSPWALQVPTTLLLSPAGPQSAHPSGSGTARAIPSTTTEWSHGSLSEAATTTACSIHRTCAALVTSAGR